MIQNDFNPSLFPEPIRVLQPEVGLILGSGLGSFVERVEIRAELSYEKIPGIPRSTVPGHAGKFVFGSIGGRNLMVAQGRVHLYEGHSARDTTSIIRAMAALGVQWVVLTNAAGCLNPSFEPGCWMQIADHINLTGTSPLLGGPNFIDMSNVYDAPARERFAAVAAELGIRLFEGVYASLPGPQYETPAEVRMIQRLGADAVGMSTVLEAIQARALGMKISGFSCLTNWGAGLKPGALSHTEVLDTGRTAAGQLERLLVKSFSEA